MAEPAAPSLARRPLSRRRKFLYALLPLTALLLVGEFAARAYRTKQGYPPIGNNSYRDQRIDLLRRGFPCEHDPLLGYVPRAGYHGEDNLWHTTVSIDERGLRRNGTVLPRATGPAVLAVGDSFTFGDQVSDAETWPARLEQLLQRPVHNGGVFGYSFAQTVLRAERLLDDLTIDTVVCSLIPDDLKRCELSRRFTPMPWFALVDGNLQLRGVPVPDTSIDNDLDRQYVRRALGYSALFDMVLWNAVPSWWVGQEREVREHPPGTGLVLGMKLLERLAARCRAGNVRLLLVLQGPAPEMPAGVPVHAPELLAHGHALGIDTLDLATRFRGLADADPTLDAKFFAGHMTPAGNQWVAEQIAAVLRAPR
jgi:hypothetical protein